MSFSHAGELDANLNATIVDTTCKFSVENGGNVYLPTVTRSWFYNADSSNRYAPTDEAGGTPFTLHVDECYVSSGIKQLTFSFSPQSGFWSNQNQVFKNDATAGAAENVGVVVADPNNGEILAMASSDPYDLNDPRDLTQFYTQEEIDAMEGHYRLFPCREMTKAEIQNLVEIFCTKSTSIQKARL